MRDVVAAFKGALEAEGLASSVFVGALPSGTPPARYALVFPVSPERVQDRQTGPQSRVTSSFVVHSVGVTVDQAMWVAERVQRVTGKRLNPAWGLVRHTSGDPMRRDTSTAPGVHFLVDEFELTTS